MKLPSKVLIFYRLNDGFFTEVIKSCNSIAKYSINRLDLPREPHWRKERWYSLSISISISNNVAAQLRLLDSTENGCNGMCHGIKFLRRVMGNSSILSHIVIHILTNTRVPFQVRLLCLSCCLLCLFCLAECPWDESSLEGMTLS